MLIAVDGVLAGLLEGVVEGQQHFGEHVDS
jgi:hypothetical protein